MKWVNATLLNSLSVICLAIAVIANSWGDRERREQIAALQAQHAELMAEHATLQSMCGTPAPIDRIRPFEHRHYAPPANPGPRT